MKIIVASPKAMCKFKKGKEEKHFLYFTYNRYAKRYFKKIVKVATMRRSVNQNVKKIATDRR